MPNRYIARTDTPARSTAARHLASLDLPLTVAMAGVLGLLTTYGLPPYTACALAACFGWTVGRWAARVEKRGEA